MFDFLNPLRIVARIRAETLDVITRGPRLLLMARMDTESVQRVAADGAEQLADVVLNAMANHDGTIAIAAVNALGDLAVDYSTSKSSLPLDFFASPTPSPRTPISSPWPPRCSPPSASSARGSSSRSCGSTSRST